MSPNNNHITTSTPPRAARYKPEAGRVINKNTRLYASKECFVSQSFIRSCNLVWVDYLSHTLKAVKTLINSTSWAV